MRSLVAALSLSSLFVALPARADTTGFQLQDGDRVVLLGSTLIEREQKYGTWETLLTTRWPNRHVTFRNLGWSGDTVFGHARARFGTPADGFKHLKEHVLGLKPTVIILGYGLNESFEGEAFLPGFLTGLNGLLDTLAPTKARVVILSPNRLEDLGRPLPDPTAANRNVRLYGDALRKVAEQRGYPFIDLFELLGDGTKTTPPAPLTDNGLHFTAFGYWRSAAALEQGLGLTPPRWRVELDQAGQQPSAEGAKVSDVQATPLRFRVLDAALPAPLFDGPGRQALPGYERVLRVRGLKPGKYILKIDGQTAATATSEEWAAGVKLKRGPEFDQVEKLRAVIIEKNRQYFHRWRPQNETYLFGFRKHEQGNNAREIPLFDPVVEKLEAEIARLRVPVGQTYEVVLQGR